MVWSGHRMKACSRIFSNSLTLPGYRWASRSFRVGPSICLTFLPIARLSRAIECSMSGNRSSFRSRSVGDSNREYLQSIIEVVPELAFFNCRG